MPSNKLKYTINSAIHLSVQSSAMYRDTVRATTIDTASIYARKQAYTQSKAEKKRETVCGYSCMQKKRGDKRD